MGYFLFGALWVGLGVALLVAPFAKDPFPPTSPKLLFVGLPFAFLCLPVPVRESMSEEMHLVFVDRGSGAPQEGIELEDVFDEYGCPAAESADAQGTVRLPACRYWRMQCIGLLGTGCRIAPERRVDVVRDGDPLGNLTVYGEFAGLEGISSESMAILPAPCLEDEERGPAASSRCEATVVASSAPVPCYVVGVS